MGISPAASCCCAVLDVSGVSPAAVGVASLLPVSCICSDCRCNTVGRRRSVVRLVVVFGALSHSCGSHVCGPVVSRSVVVVP